MGGAAQSGWEIDAGFDLDGFLARPLVAHVAAAGPTVRPVWFLWEEHSFWWLTGAWSRLGAILGRDPIVALVVDTCELQTGRVLQVTVRGSAAVLPFDPTRARRKLARYLGPDESRWDRERFAIGGLADDSTRFVRLTPDRLRARDLSYEVA